MIKGLLDLKFSIPGFFGQVFFVWLDLNEDLIRDFLGCLEQSDD